MALFDQAGQFLMPFGWHGAEREDHEFLFERGSELEITGLYTAPEQVDPRGWLSIRNQNPQQSCPGHGTTCAMRICNWFKTQGGVIDLSTEFTYLMAQKMCGVRGDQGATIDGAIKGGQKYGFCLEETFPYQKSYEDAVRNLPREAFDEAEDHKLLSYSPGYALDDIYKGLGAGVGAWVVGSPWPRSWATAQAGTPIDSFDTTDILGNHCYCIAGYLRNGCLILINSWGEEWCDRGTAILTPEVARQMISNNQCVFMLVSDMQTFQGGRASWIRSNPTYHNFDFAKAA